MSGAEFPFRIRLGIFLMFESAGLSAAAVAILLSYVAYRTLKRHRSRRALQKRMRKESMNTAQFLLLTEENTDAADSSFFIGLMLGELIQAIGGLFDIQWVLDGKVTNGPLCTAQGLIKQYGDVTVAFMSLTIAVQTFCVLVIRCHIPPWASKYIIGVVVTIVTLLVGASAGTLMHSGKGPYYADTGFWCWIGNNFKVEKIVLEYLWLWLAAFIMLILYGVTALVMRGILVVGDESNDKGKWKLKWNWQANQRGNVTSKNFTEMKDWTGAGDEERRQAKAVANLMLFYPAIYIFCVFPIGLVRWLTFSGHNIPQAATIFADFIFTLSGLFNSILYVLTRPELVKGSGSDSGSIRERPFMPQGSGGSIRAVEKRVLPKLYGLGHLPDRDDDDIRDQEAYPHAETGIEKVPWTESDLSQSHSRSDSGDSFLRSIVRDSADGQPGSVSPNLHTHLHMVPMVDDLLPHKYVPKTSLKHQQRRRWRLESSDPGFLTSADYYTQKSLPQKLHTEIGTTNPLFGSSQGVYR